MAYKLENIDGCTKKFVFDFPTVDLTGEIKKALVEKQKAVNIKGFRKGKAPLTMVEQIYRTQIEQDALMSFISKEYATAIEKESLRPTAYPSISKTKYDAGKSVSFEAIVEIFPEIKVSGVEKLSFEKKPVAFGTEDLENVKTRLLESKATMEEVTDKNAKIENGVFAVVDFEGELESGETMPELNASEVMIEVGAGKFLPDFETGLLGMKKDEKKKIEVKFPEDYQDERFTNKKVFFNITVHELKTKKFPEFTEELVKEFGHESISDFENKVKDSILKQRKKEQEEDLFKNILEKLIETTPFEVPKSLVMKQEEFLKDDLSKTLKNQGMNTDMMSEYFSKWSEDLSRKAEYQVRSGLILDSLANDYKIETKDQDIQNKVEELTLGTSLKKEDVLNYYYSSNENMKNLHYKIREEKTFKKLLEIVKVSEVA